MGFSLKYIFGVTIIGNYGIQGNGSHSSIGSLKHRDFTQFPGFL